MSQKYGFEKATIFALSLIFITDPSHGSETTSPQSKIQNKKVDLLVKAATLDREAVKKQTSNPDDAKNLRAEAKKIRNQANKMK